MSRLSNKIVEQIPIEYEKSHNKAKVARDLKISVGTVDRYLKLASVVPKTSKRTKITPEIVEEINKLYKETRNMSEVSRRLGISTITIKKNLTEENLNLQKTQNEDKEALWYYIYKLFGCEPVSSWNATQMERFRRQGINYKAQLLILKYFFEIKKSSVEKANGSIGIIPWVASEAEQYWLKEVEKRKKIEEGIKAQLAQDRITIKYDPTEYWGKNKKKKKEIDLSTLEGSN